MLRKSTRKRKAPGRLQEAGQRNAAIAVTCTSQSSTSTFPNTRSYTVASPVPAQGAYTQPGAYSLPLPYSGPAQGAYTLVNPNPTQGAYTQANSGPAQGAYTPGIPVPTQGAFGNLGPDVACQSTTLGNISTCSLSLLNQSSQNSQSISTASDNLSMHVSASNKEKICKGEYIDLALLLQNNYIQQKPNQTISLISGELVIQQKQQQKITNIEQWTDAFIVYTSIFCHTHPSNFQQMLKYLNNIRTAAKRCGNNLGWKNYDETFRLKKAQDPSYDWGTIDTELWLMFVNQTGATSLSTSSTFMHKCYAYNYNGYCTRPQCTYSHSCIRCFAAHPLIKCYKANFNRNPNVGQNFSFPTRFTDRSRYPTNVRQANVDYNFRQFRPRAPRSVMGFRSHPR